MANITSEMAKAEEDVYQNLQALQREIDMLYVQLLVDEIKTLYRSQATQARRPTVHIYLAHSCRNHSQSENHQNHHHDRQSEGRCHSSSRECSQEISVPQVQQSCGRCGRVSCRGGIQCLAHGRSCHKCGKLNHFKSVCRSGTPWQGAVGLLWTWLMMLWTGTAVDPSMLKFRHITGQNWKFWLVTICRIIICNLMKNFECLFQ